MFTILHALGMFVADLFKSRCRLEWRPQNGQYETKQRDHGLLTLGDSFG
jgi:hypothetical protein